MFEEAVCSFSLIRQQASKSSGQGLSVLFLFIPESDYCFSLLLPQSTSPGVRVSEACGEHQSPWRSRHKCVRATSKKSRVYTLVPEEGTQTLLWHFLSLFKNPSLFLSDVWKKEVYQQALELKRYQGRYLMQPLILRDASVSGHNPGTVR